ncbi:OB-fold domain-containing protein [Saccharopolyspora indica]|uniref:Zn-ribbon domain-containing OB-fold protein n=1 Tax=Saccharopolyspora indica TaxID=1229659 RepID=UPI0022EA6B39|nr:OB-fold domain-containing protein [Saccharopolyspora indica]MDA3644229.1 OB-fold domain-containing protein [Saccharopolyspora indica]
MGETTTLHDWPQPYRLLDAQPYWDALSGEELTFQHCADCEQAVWPAHSRCPGCSSAALSWKRSSGRGTIYSHSTIMRGPTPVWAAIVPYTVGFVHMAEDYFLFAQIDGDPEEIEIGRAVAVRYVQRGEQKLPVFALADGREQ